MAEVSGEGGLSYEIMEKVYVFISVVGGLFIWRGGCSFLWWERGFGGL